METATVCDEQKTRLFNASDVIEILDCFDHDTERYRIVDDGEWIDDGKYQSKVVVFEDLEDGTLWEARDCRSGSYYSDYFYESETWPKDGIVELNRVVPVVKTITTYMSVDAAKRWADEMSSVKTPVDCGERASD